MRDAHPLLLALALTAGFAAGLVVFWGLVYLAARAWFAAKIVTTTRFLKSRNQEHTDGDS